MVCMNKGDSGKTSLVINLASNLVNNYNKKILIIDMDPQGSCSNAFGINQNSFDKTIFDVLTEKQNPKDCIYNLSDNIDLLPSNDDMYSFDLSVVPNLTVPTDIHYLLRNKLKSLEEDYDYIFIDSPPTFGNITALGLMYTENVLIPVTPNNYSLSSLTETIKTIDGVKDVNPSLNISGIISVRVDIDSALHSDLLKKVHEFSAETENYVFNTVIPMYQKDNPEESLKNIKIAYDKLTEEFLSNEIK